MSFDLEEQIRLWKQSFTTTDGMRRADIEELEHHVRDSMATLSALGLNPQEAFIVATHRVGAPVRVAREFAKVNGSRLWYQQVGWMTAGALGYAICGLVIGALASLSQVVALLAGGQGAAVGLAAVAITCMGWAVVAALLYRRRTEDSRPARLTDVSAGVLASVVVLAVIAGSLVKFGGQLVLGRLMPVSEFAWAQLISNVAALTATVLMPLLLLLAVQLLRTGYRLDDRTRLSTE